MRIGKKKNSKFIELSESELKQLKDRTTDIPGLIEYAHERGGFSVTLTNSQEIRNDALKSMNEQVEVQLEMLHERMKVLASQAQSLKTRAEVSEQLFELSPRFTPVSGQVYYLYQRKNGEQILSLISPHEWKQMPFEKFIASVKYLADKTWQLV